MPRCMFFLFRASFPSNFVKDRIIVTQSVWRSSGKSSRPQCKKLSTIKTIFIHRECGWSPFTKRFYFRRKQNHFHRNIMKFRLLLASLLLFSHCWESCVIRTAGKKERVKLLQGEAQPPSSSLSTTIVIALITCEKVGSDAKVNETRNAAR